MFSVQIFISLSLVGFASADYHIGVVVRNITFVSPLNTLFDGSCCNSSCGRDQACCATTSCSPTLRLCFRESQRSREDVDSECPILEIARTQANQRFVVLGTDILPIQRYYTGNFQVYIRISNSEDGTPDFSPPFTDPLIDIAFLEFSQLPTVLYENRLNPNTQTLTISGAFGRVTVEIRALVHCSRGWNGTACEFFNNTRIYSEPTSAPTSFSTGPSANPSVGPTGGVEADTSSDDGILAIAVGVSVGVAIFILVVIAIIVIIFVVKRKRTWRKTFTPNTLDLSYTLKVVHANKTATHVSPILEPKDDHVYAVVRKNGKGGTLSY